MDKLKSKKSQRFPFLQELPVRSSVCRNAMYRDFEQKAREKTCNLFREVR